MVGDPCQNIFGFRGADSSNLQELLDFIKDRDGYEASLSHSYRCPDQVVRVAERVAGLDSSFTTFKHSKSKPKVLYPKFDCRADTHPGHTLGKALLSQILEIEQ